MKYVIITRHAGLVAWLKDKGITCKTIVSHATEDKVCNEHIIGALPMHLAALAASVTVVDMPLLRPEQRGKDLTPAEMDAAGATMRRYKVYPD